MAKKKTAPKKANDGKGVFAFYKLAAIIMSKVGIAGFVVISIVVYIFWFVPEKQKEELTNTWLLFKSDEHQNIYVVLFVSLAIVVFMQTYFCRKSMKLKDERIKEISKEKTVLQEKLLNKELKSSNNNDK